MNSRTLIELENYYLKKLKDIDDYINTIKGKLNYEEKRMYTIMKLDKIEKEIMTRDWSNDYSSKRKSFRPLIYKLYKKLNYCPPKRNKQDFERKYEEPYKDPEHNPNRADLSNCEPEDVHELYNYYVKELKNINDYIIEVQNLSKQEYKQRRETIILHLDNLEERIMKHNWDYRTHN